MCKKFVYLVLCIIGQVFAIQSHTEVLPEIEAFICISSEDEKYNVKGGIGTYLGILTKEIKRLYPSMPVYWISKSPHARDFSEIDAYGIERYYFSDTCLYADQPFYRYLDLDKESEAGTFIKQQLFLNKVNEKTSEILSQLRDKNVVIECGEWEGIAHQLFRTIHDKKVLKAARIHTPLAVTLKSNKLDVSLLNKVQLIHEFEVLKNADCISSCTQFIKDELIEEVLKADLMYQQHIQVIPNPVDCRNYHPRKYKRTDSIAKINKILGSEFITQDTLNIYVIGSVETRKGAELVLGAVPHIIEKIPHARICFLGHHGGNESKALTANLKLSPEMLLQTVPAQYRKQVAFAGYVDHADIPLIIESGDLFPIMYLGDNFPGTVAEIALMEKPIIALSRGGVNEMLRDETGNYIAYELGSSLTGASERLAQAIIEMHNDAAYCDAMGKKLGAHMRQKYAPEKVTKDLLKYYQTCFIKKS